MSHFRHLRDHWVSNKLIVVDNSASKIRRTRRMCTQNYLEIGPESRYTKTYNISVCHQHHNILSSATCIMSPT